VIARRLIRRRELAPPPAGQQDSLPAGLHPVSRRVLQARGVFDAAALALDLRGLHPPGTLSGIEGAAELLAEAITGGQSLLVVGDFDADGATGTALAMLALRAMGCARADFRVPNRFEFGYGLTAPLVETLADAPPDLLVTVDSGIACIDGVKRARELGCRVVVTDHHLPGERLPEANAIVNPNAPGDRFPSKCLAGVGVMFYLLSAVRGRCASAAGSGAGGPSPTWRSCSTWSRWAPSPTWCRWTATTASWCARAWSESGAA
jgi:single-stranded-DNA-specific exonuclease